VLSCWNYAKIKRIVCRKSVHPVGHSHIHVCVLRCTVLKMWVQLIVSDVGTTSFLATREQVISDYWAAPAYLIYWWCDLISNHENVSYFRSFFSSRFFAKGEFKWNSPCNPKLNAHYCGWVFRFFPPFLFMYNFIMFSEYVLVYVFGHVIMRVFKLSRRFRWGLRPSGLWCRDAVWWSRRFEMTLFLVTTSIYARDDDGLNWTKTQWI
jgi:hypothetical protein